MCKCGLSAFVKIPSKAQKRAGKAAKRPHQGVAGGKRIAARIGPLFEPAQSHSRFAQRHLPLSAVGARPSIAPRLRYVLRLGISDAYDGLAAGAELTGQGSHRMAF